jgi:16S rRNA (guanine527-N7)-methyltransferase
LRNDGAVASGPFSVKWIVDGAPAVGGHDSLDPGQISTGNVNFDWTPSTSGLHTLRFEADFDLRIEETNEGNNAFQVTVNLGGPAQADLVVDDISFSSPPEVGVETLATARLRNLGATGSGGFEVRWTLDGGPVVDVGSGGGTPGIPLAASLPGREVTLLEAERRKVEFLRGWEAELPNLRVLWGRAEEQPVEKYGVALAKALAPPPVAAEWCLPLVRAGGAAILWLGPSADTAALATAAEQVAGRLEESPAGFAVLRKVGPTPAGFPRRSGIAKKRPLA